MVVREAEDQKQRIRESNDILDVVRSYGIELKRTGRNWKGCCPFHQEKTPSFNVNQEGQYFKCFGCGKSGDVFTFVVEQERVGFREALRLLGDRVGIELQEDPAARTRHRQERDWKSYLYKLNAAAAAYYHEQLLSKEGKVARDYLTNRGIDEASWERFSIGYAPRVGHLLQRLQRQKAPVKALERAGLVSLRDDGSAYEYFRDRLMFPIGDSQGRVIGFGGRVLGDGEPKYLNTRETLLFKKSQTVYGLAQARDAMVEQRRAVLVEGYTDVVMCHQYGVKNVVAALGTAITQDHVRLLRRQADELVMMTDADVAGAQASERSLDILFQEDMPASIVRLTGDTKDPCEFLKARGKEAFEAELANAASLFDFKFQCLSARIDLHSPSGQAMAAREMMRLISLSPDPIHRAAYRRDVAGRLNLPEQELAFSTHPTTTAPSPATHNLGKESLLKPENALAHAERELLRWVFHQPAWLEALMGEIDLTSLCGRLERCIGLAVCRGLDAGRLPPDIDTLSREDGTPAGAMAREVLAQLAAEKSIPVDDSEHGPGEPDPDLRDAQRLCITLAEEDPEHKRLTHEEAYEIRVQAVRKARLQFDLDRARRAEAAARAQGHSDQLREIQGEILNLQQQLMLYKRG